MASRVRTLAEGAVMREFEWAGGGAVGRQGLERRAAHRHCDALVSVRSLPCGEALFVWAKLSLPSLHSVQSGLL